MLVIASQVSKLFVVYLYTTLVCHIVVSKILSIWSKFTALKYSQIQLSKIFRYNWLTPTMWPLISLYCVTALYEKLGSKESAMPRVRQRNYGSHKNKCTDTGQISESFISQSLTWKGKMLSNPQATTWQSSAIYCNEAKRMDSIFQLTLWFVLLSWPTYQACPKTLMFHNAWYSWWHQYDGTSNSVDFAQANCLWSF